MNQTLKEAGYKYLKFLGDRQHWLQDIVSGDSELFFSNFHNASWSIKWKNTHLEFARGISKKEINSHPQNHRTAKGGRSSFCKGRKESD
jgi:hypothetical protein